MSEINLAAHFALQNTSIAVGSESMAEGGRSDSDESSDSQRCGENSTIPERII